MLRPLRLPGLLIGDARLGGVSATLAAADSLALRGYDVPAVALLADADAAALRNDDAIARHLRAAARACSPGGPMPTVHVLPSPPPPPPNALAAGERGIADPLRRWLEVEVAPGFDGLLQALLAAHTARLRGLREAGPEAARLLWWPFTQHAALPPGGGAAVIDSRCGEALSVYTAATPTTDRRHNDADVGEREEREEREEEQREWLQPQVDACASWWTQGLAAQLQPQLARTVGYAAGRWGHVMFAEHAHAPSLAAARALLAHPGAGWASRVFYTDNGAGAVEVALKMAMRKRLLDCGLGVAELLALDSAEQQEKEQRRRAASGDKAASPPPSASPAPRPQHAYPRLRILALAGSYHGDTLGAMMAQVLWD